MGIFKIKGVREGCLEWKKWVGDLWNDRGEPGAALGSFETVEVSGGTQNKIGEAARASKWNKEAGGFQINKKKQVIVIKLVNASQLYSLQNTHVNFNKSKFSICLKSNRTFMWKID